MTATSPEPAEAIPRRERAGAAADGGLAPDNGAPAARLWHQLTRPWLLALTAVPALLMLTAAWLLPQLPGQLRNEPAAAARWLAGHSDAYGALGGVLAAVGAFDVLESPLLRALLAVIGFLLLVHLADQLAAARLMRRLRRRLAEPSAPGEPLPVLSLHPLHRRRYAQEESPTKSAARLESRLAVAFDAVQRTALPPTDNPSPEVDDEAGQRIRLLAVRAPWAPYLRALCLSGLLLTLAGVWLVAYFGWSLSLTALAPGGSYRNSVHGVVLNYEMTSAGPGLAAPVLLITVDQEMGQLEVAEGERLWVGNADVRVEPDAPGLLVETADGRASLVRPGQNRGAPQAGLVFPAVGSEETLLLPDDGLGLRVVRSAESATPFLVEVYESDDVQPVQRIPLSADGVATLPVGDAAVDVRFTPMPSLAISVRHTPAPWLFWIAVGLTVAGSIGFLRAPAFLLAQVDPWPPARAVVVVQSQRSADPQQL